ncbi:MAG: YaeQ family protein [Pseudomonadaceae bacterium]|nr:YaeQ family protein [Pseudomonadaceae bacterium]
MALKPTIYKFAISLSDVDANRYEELALTVALHPSETIERMMVRVLAYCLNLDDGLEFTRGLSDTDEPDLLQRSLDDRILTWIEVGEPSAERLRKARNVSEQVLVYTFNSKSDSWWQQVSADAERLGTSVFQLDWHAMQQLAALTTRNLSISVTIADASIYVAADTGTVELSVQTLSAV